MVDNYKLHLANIKQTKKKNNIMVDVECNTIYSRRSARSHILVPIVDQVLWLMNKVFHVT